MDKPEYTKPPLDYQQQLEQLERRGLIIQDEGKALHLLQHISYYRLSGYWYPLLADKQNHLFKTGASFDTAFQLYCFDRKLRQLVMAELEKIEVAVRARMIYILSNTFGSYWYQNSNLFKNKSTHALTLGKMEEEFKRSDEEFITAFKKHYSTPLPPAWIILEITSFGTLSKLYNQLNPGKEKREIAACFGLPDSVLITWLHSIVYLRNVCAHHGRLWNRIMRIAPQVPRTPRLIWLTNNHIVNNRSYFMLSMILFLLQSVNPHNTFAVRIKDLLAAYPNVDPEAMGFPERWTQEALWQ